jgi:hypothetical protein
MAEVFVYQEPDALSSRSTPSWPRCARGGHAQRDRLAGRPPPVVHRDPSSSSSRLTLAAARRHSHGLLGAQGALAACSSLGRRWAEGRPKGRLACRRAPPRWSLATRGSSSALPTQATSNQMFGRVKTAIRRTRDGDISNPESPCQREEPRSLLTEYQALRVQRRFTTTRRARRGIRGGEVVRQTSAHCCVCRGHRRSRRSLPRRAAGATQLCPAFFRRERKTVILDEVNAYDTYVD